LKDVVQELTASAVISQFGFQSVAVGVYFGVQTGVFEVGLAYIVAVYAVKRGSLHLKDAEGYGFSLAFWENGVLLSLLTLINIVSI